ncbi:hypothetical protein JW960_10035 [candidate division KSB1 bacterium]|nr:hypothetical protein [candidate division KSB1 bacterium]
MLIQRIWIISVLFAFIGLSGCTHSSQIEKSAEWDRISDGEYLVENCTWNVAAAHGSWKEIIFCDTMNGSRGWRWDFSKETDNPAAYVIKSYPEIIFGRKPYDGYESTSPRLPIALRNAQFTIEYDYKVIRANGIYNTTTDITFTDSVTPHPENIRAKLMIWFDHLNMDFFQSKFRTQTVIGGRRHEVFIDRNHTGPEGAWIFIALLPEKLPHKGKIDLTEYFNFCLSTGALKPEWFVSSIEIGSEIASGKGEVQFKQFLVP